ncbi:MAG: ATP-binding protein [Candidatus Manganitrophaceae bacterium]
MDNIDEQKKIDAALYHLIEMEKRIAATSTRFINLPSEETDRGIQQALEEIGTFAGVDRSYVFLFRDGGAKADNTHEWCAEGIQPEIKNLQGLSMETFSWWMDQLKRSGSVHIPRIADFPPEARAEKELGEAQGIQSVLAVPMISQGTLLGFIGFDSVRTEKRWAEEDIRLLRIVGEIFSNALERKRLEAVRLASLYQMESMHQISKVIEQTPNRNEMLQELMERVGLIFKADRAWLLYPCDPEAPTFKVPVEYTVPEYPGLFAKGEERPMDAASAETCRAALTSEEPLTFGAGPDRPTPADPALIEEFSIQSQMTIALHPKLGKPWLLGLHQCSSPRIWTPDERRLFRDISDKIADALDNQLLYRNLRRAEEEYRSVVDNIQEVIFHTDTEGRFLFLNPAWRDLTGFPAYKSLGTRLFDYLDPADRSHCEERFRLAIRGQKEPTRCETRLRTEKGEIRWIQIDIHATLDGAFGTINDITERRSLEEQLRHAHKMEGVGQLTGGVAHEFNNLLTAIIGNLDLAIQEIPSGSDLHLFLAGAYQAARRGAGLTQQLLSFARRNPIDLQPLDLGHEATEIVRLLRQTIDRRIEIGVEAREGLWPVLADANQVNQVIMNLCVNARDALLEQIEGTPHSPRRDPRDPPSIRLRIGNVHFEEADCQGRPDVQPGDYVEFSVSDNGCGIDESIQHRIFEPFFTTKEVGRGTGLGLSAVYGIVAQHQGWIELDTAKNRGTTFRVYLPRTDRPVASIPSPASGENRSRGSGTILFVDDEEVIRRLGRTILELEGYTVLLAEDGEKAIDLFRDRHEEIVLAVLDLTMPGQSGREVLWNLRKIDPRIKAIISSGHHTAGGDQGWSDFPDVGFLPKPYRPDELIGKIRRLLDQTTS